MEEARSSQQVRFLPVRILFRLRSAIVTLSLESMRFLAVEKMSIMQTPSGYCQQVPQVSIAQTYLKIMNRFCEQFGMTPSARSRIVTDKGDDKESDAMELLLVKGGSG